MPGRWSPTLYLYLKPIPKRNYDFVFDYVAQHTLSIRNGPINAIAFPMGNIGAIAHIIEEDTQSQPINVQILIVQIIKKHDVFSKTEAGGNGPRE